MSKAKLEEFYQNKTNAIYDLIYNYSSSNLNKFKHIFEQVKAKSLTKNYNAFLDSIFNPAIVGVIDRISEIGDSEAKNLSREEKLFYKLKMMNEILNYKTIPKISKGRFLESIVQAYIKTQNNNNNNDNGEIKENIIEAVFKLSKDSNYDLNKRKKIKTELDLLINNIKEFASDSALEFILIDMINHSDSDRADAFVALLQKMPGNKYGDMNEAEKTKFDYRAKKIFTKTPKDIINFIKPYLVDYSTEDKNVKYIQTQYVFKQTIKDLPNIDIKILFDDQGKLIENWKNKFSDLAEKIQINVQIYNISKSVIIDKSSLLDNKSFTSIKTLKELYYIDQYYRKIYDSQLQSQSPLPSLEIKDQVKILSKIAETYIKNI